MDAETLRQKVKGEVVARGDAAYEARRREMVWNRLTPERQPEILLRVADVADVVAGLRFARDRGLGVAIRGGGHHWSGTCLRDGTLLLDVSGLDAIEIDANARSAWVQPGVENRVLSQRLGEHRLAFPYGHCGEVKMSGYLLSGGLGWNPGTWGPACANVEAVEVITADGRTRVADESHAPDLFWAARGAGAGFFGVVTRFKLKLHPLPGCIRTATLVYPVSRVGEIGAWAEDVVPRLSRKLELGIFLAAPPDLASACAADNGMACLIMATAFAADEREADLAFAPLATPPDGALMHVPPQDTPFEALFAGVEQLFESDQRWLADTFVVPAPQAFLTEFGRLYARAPSNRSVAVISVANPAVCAGALSLPAGTFVLPYATWRDARDDDANRAWFAEVVALLEPHAIGHYVGESDLDRGSRAERCYAPADWQRLQSLRRRYDPDGVFAGYPGS